MAETAEKLEQTFIIEEPASITPPFSQEGVLQESSESSLTIEPPQTLLLQNAPSLILEFSGNRPKVIKFNTLFEKLLKRTPHSMDLDDPIFKDTYDYAAAYEEYEKNGGFAVSFLKRYSTSDNESIDTLARLYIADKETKIATFAFESLVSYRDNIIAEEERRYKKLVDIAIHDTSQPIASALGWLERIDQTARDAMLTPNKRFIKIVQSAVTALESLRSAPEIMRSKFKREMSKTTFMFDEVVHTAMKTTKGVYESHDFVLEGDHGLTLDADKALMQSVVNNLLSNAAKYSSQIPSLPNPTVTIHMTRQENSLQFTVQDQGIGMTKEDQLHVFSPRYRVDEVIGKYEGKGLGLAEVKEIIEKHSGTITVTSEPGKGSTFTVNLPLSTPAVAS